MFDHKLYFLATRQRNYVSVRLHVITPHLPVQTGVGLNLLVHRPRSVKAQRLMLGKEQLSVLGFPCWPKTANAARTVSCLEASLLLFWMHSGCVICSPLFSPTPVVSIPRPQDTVYVDHLLESALRSIAGNGMSIPCAGFVLLMTLLCVSDKP